MNLAKALLPLVGLALSASAGAASWNTSNDVALTSGSIYCSTTTCQSGNSSGLTGSIITLSGYSTPTAATGTTSPIDTGSWISASIAIYGGGGVGITGAGESGSPQHAIDNRIRNDILVVDFGSNNWDVSSFSLGWTCIINSTNGCGTPSGNVNVAAWVGGTSAIDFTTVSFSASGAAATLAGFTELTPLSSDPGGPGIRGVSSSAVGRYLVITGDLTRSKDAFKVSGIGADQIPGGPGGGQIPVPGSLPLIVLGLLALAWATTRRRVVLVRARR